MGRSGGALVNRVRVLLLSIIDRGGCIVRDSIDGRRVGIVASLGYEEQDANPESTAKDESEVVDCRKERTTMR